MTSKVRVLNNDQVCSVCRRRAHGLAVGKRDRAAWFCEPCGPSLARTILHMPQDQFDGIERDAIDAILEQLPETITVPDAERAMFIGWIIDTFGTEIRKAAENGSAPF